MTGNGGSPDESIASQRARLASLEACEDQIRALRDRECDLEVEQIAAQAAVHSAAGRLKPDIDEALAARIGRSLEHRRKLEERLRDAGADRGGRGSGGARKLDELRGGTFTLTSVGSIGGVFATPILNVPEVAILGVNAIRDAAVVRNGEVVVRKMMYLSPSFDHRVIDGAVGARFIAALKQVLENPEALLLELS